MKEVRQGVRWASAGFALGIAGRSVLWERGEIAWLFLLLAAAMLAAAWVRRSHAGAWLALFLCALSGGAMRTAGVLEELALAEAAFPDGAALTLPAVVVREPEVRARFVHYTVAVPYGAGRTARLLLFADPYPRFSYGDKILLRGRAEAPHAFESGSGRTFPYPQWLKKEGVVRVMYRPAMEKVGEGEGSALVGMLFSLKRTLLSSLARLLPDPALGLAAGLLFGEKRALGDTWIEALRATGVVHIVVLSGYNITLVGEALRGALRFLPPALQWWGGGAAMVAFAAMVGGGATVVRATLMGLVALAARATGNLYEITHALLLAALAMLAFNPLLLVFDPSFQLSFLATVGLIHGAPLAERLFSFIPATLGLRGFAAATLATQVAVLPLLLYQTGLLSLVALPANLLVLAATPAAMLLSFLAGLAGVVSATLAAPFAFSAWALLSYQLEVVRRAAALPFAALTVPAFPFWVVLAGYGALGAAWWRWGRGRRAAPGAE